MNYTPNYEFHLPERNEQFNLEHWNQNTEAIDTRMHTNQVNIATNASNISNIISNLTTNKSNDSSSTYFKLMKLIYPIGSIYWSGNNTNPATLFGGTWVQIKDKFIWAKGNNDTLGAIGGAKTVTLTVNNLPSHNHSFTPAGTIGITTNPTFTGSSVNSGVNSRGHTHTLNNENTSSSGTITTAGIRHSGSTGDNSANPSFSWSGSHTHSSSTDFITSGVIDVAYNRGNPKIFYGLPSSITLNSATINVSGTTTGSHTHTMPESYIYGSTDSESQNHTHSVTANGTISGGVYSFSGTDGTTDSKGSGTAVDIMPPYVVKYCWERTA